MNISIESRDWRQVYGFLPDWAIVNMIKERVIGLNPLGKNWEENMGPVSVDFHLGERILIPKHQDWKVINVRYGVKLEDHDEIKLQPGQDMYMKAEHFIIAEVREKLSLPTDVIGFVEGKSSLARLGLVVHLTAGRFDPGWDGTPVLEFKNNSKSDLAVPYGWPICAFTFYRMMARVDYPYSTRGKYTGFEGIHSLVHREPENKEGHANS